MTLEHIATLELATAELARIGGGDAALVALVAHQGGLVQVGAPAAGARVLVGVRVPPVLWSAPATGPVLQVEACERREGAVKRGEDRSNTF